MVGEQIRNLNKKAMDLFVASNGRLIESFTLAKSCERLANAIDSVEIEKDIDNVDTLGL